MFLDEKIIAIERALELAQVPHAFGGAHALAYYAPPRATLDIDLNVFVPTTRARRVLGILADLGADRADTALLQRIERDGQVRVFWNETPLDLFFAYDSLHQASMQRRRSVDFGGVAIHVLSAEDLMIYKLLFSRERDWRDIAEMIRGARDRLDFDYVRGWLERILPEGTETLPRLQALIDSRGNDLAR